MIAKKLDRPSALPGTGVSATLSHEALTMALAILAERIRGLPVDDKQDLVALVQELPNSDAEELESIVLTMREILEQSPSKIQKMNWTGGRAGHPPALKQWMDFASQRIAEARTKVGLSQSQLAEKSGLPQSHISRLECGKHSPSRATLERIATALGIPVSKLDPSAE